MIPENIDNCRRKCFNFIFLSNLTVLLLLHCLWWNSVSNLPPSGDEVGGVWSCASIPHICVCSWHGT